MSIIKKSRLAILATLIAVLSMPAFAGDHGKKRFVFMPGAGDALEIVPPGSPAGGGFHSNLYTLRGGYKIGSFTTDIISGDIIFDVLAQLTFPGAIVDVDQVAGSFQTAFGKITDIHKPTVIVLNEPTSILSGGLVMVAVAEGTITGGTGIFTGSSGTTSLYLRFEVNPADNFATAVVSGSFVFDLH